MAEECETTWNRCGPVWLIEKTIDPGKNTAIKRKKKWFCSSQELLLDNVKSR